MRSLICRKLEMGARVREFVRAHISTEPGYGPALAQLEERLTRAQAIDARLQETLESVRTARTRRLELRREIQSASTARLTRLVAEFEAESESAGLARRTFHDARKDLEELSIDVMELVKLIGALTSYRFGNDHEVLADWLAARHIPRAPRKTDKAATDIRPAA